MNGEQEIQRRTAAARAAIAALVEAVVEAELTEDAEPERADVAEALARVRAAGQGRDRARAVVEGLVDEVAEAALDRELVAARAVRPRGASWRELGAVLGVSHQALSKRAGRRGLDTSRAVVSGRVERRRAAASASRARDEATAEPVPHAPAPIAAQSAEPRPAGSGAAFWQAQNPR